MTRNFKFLSSFLSLSLVLSSCSEDKKPKPKDEMQPQSFGLFTGAPSTLATIKVVNSNREPIANARVLFGQALNSPIENNFVTTDANGEAQLPAGFSTNMPVTVDAEGFVRQTQMQVALQGATIQLNRKNNQRMELNGQVSQLPVQNNDGQVDFGLVIPALTKADMLNFDMSSVISPLNDTITVVGNELNIPSNVSLPNQKERYIISITLNKPTYRMFFTEPGQRRVFAAQGRFPFKTVVDEFRSGKQFYELINHFTISSGAIRDVNITNNVTQMDLPANEMNFSQKKNFKAPIVGKDELFISLAATDISGYMVPTDIKKVESQKTQTLNTSANQEAYLVSALLRANEFGGASASTRMSANLRKFDEGASPTLLPLMANPTFANNGMKVIMPTMKGPANISPLATVLTLSLVENIKSGEKTVEVLNRQWEVYGADWMSEVEMPVWPNEARLPGKKRWEVNYIGSEKVSSSQQPASALDSATHVTRSFADFN